MSDVIIAAIIGVIGTIIGAIITGNSRQVRHADDQRSGSSGCTGWFTKFWWGLVISMVVFRIVIGLLEVFGH